MHYYSNVCNIPYIVHYYYSNAVVVGVVLLSLLGPSLMLIV